MSARRGYTRRLCTHEAWNDYRNNWTSGGRARLATAGKENVEGPLRIEGSAVRDARSARGSGDGSDGVIAIGETYVYAIMKAIIEGGARKGEQ